MSFYVATIMRHLKPAQRQKGLHNRQTDRKRERERRHFVKGGLCICHVLCVRWRSADSQVLLDPRSHCSGSATVLPRRYSGSKTLIFTETVLITQNVKEKRANRSVSIARGCCRRRIDRQVVGRSQIEIRTYGVYHRQYGLRANAKNEDRVLRRSMKIVTIRARTKDQPRICACCELSGWSS